MPKKAKKGRSKGQSTLTSFFSIAQPSASSTTSVHKGKPKRPTATATVSSAQIGDVSPGRQTRSMSPAKPRVSDVIDIETVEFTAFSEMDAPVSPICSPAPSPQVQPGGMRTTKFSQFQASAEQGVASPTADRTSQRLDVSASQGASTSPTKRRTLTRRSADTEMASGRLDVSASQGARGKTTQRERERESTRVLESESEAESEDLFDNKADICSDDSQYEREREATPEPKGEGEGEGEGLGAFRATSPPKPRARVLSGSKLKKLETGNVQVEPTCKYKFLKDGKLRDANKRFPSDPDYDCRSLYISPSDYSSFSPFEKQFWDIKRCHFDVIIFFRKGSFWELYETDAEVGHSLLGLKLTKSRGLRLAGMPLKSYHAYAARLVRAGFRVGRVQEMERSQMKVSGQNCVRRELVELLSPGTVDDPDLLVGMRRSGLLGVSCHPSSPGVISVCAYNPVTNTATLENLALSASHAALISALALSAPAEILACGVSGEVRRILRSAVDSSRHLIVKDAPETATAAFDSLGDLGSELAAAVSAFGVGEGERESIVHAGWLVGQYLHSLSIDGKRVDLRFVPGHDIASTHCYVDGSAILGLSLVDALNITRVQGSASVLASLDRCATSMGRRLLRQWLLRPLRDTRMISARHRSISSILSSADYRQTLAQFVAAVPDIPLLVRRATTVVDSDAQMARLLHALSSVCAKVESLRHSAMEAGEKGLISEGLASPVWDSLGQLMADVTSSHVTLNSDKSITLVAAPGSDMYNIEERRQSLESELNDVLRTIRRELRCATIRWESMGKRPFLLVTPAKLKDKCPSEWEM
ncbi:hypothetical protein KIPB_003755, partial [Kipferlia bialata]|eukprot:g3755.t1